MAIARTAVGDLPVYIIILCRGSGAELVFPRPLPLISHACALSYPRVSLLSTRACLQQHRLLLHIFLFSRISAPAVAGFGANNVERSDVDASGE